jgi:hypothetical protein
MGLYRDRPVNFLSFLDLLRNLFIERTTCVMQLEHTIVYHRFLLQKTRTNVLGDMYRSCAYLHQGFISRHEALRARLFPSMRLVSPEQHFHRNFCFRRSTSAIPFGPCTTFGHQAYHVAAKRRSEGSSLRPGRREQPRARPGGAAVNRDDGCGVGRWERHAMHRCDRGRSAAEVAQISCDTPYGETMDRAFVSNRSTRSHTYSDSVASCGHFRASCGRFRSVLPRGRSRDRFNSPV